MADVSQIMRIAQGLPPAVSGGAQKLAAAVDGLPFMAHSPETMSSGQHTRAALDKAVLDAAEGYALLQTNSAFHHADHGVMDAIGYLGRALVTTPPEQQFVNAGWNDLIHTATRRFDDTVRALSSPGSY